jgi:hypothetical protein
MHQRARTLDGKIIIRHCIKQAAFNFVTTSQLVFVIYGTLLNEHCSYFERQENYR